MHLVVWLVSLFAFGLALMWICLLFMQACEKI